MQFADKNFVHRTISTPNHSNNKTNGQYRVLFKKNDTVSKDGCGVSKGSALRLRLTGSVAQPMSCYDLLSYKAIGSNYLSFVVTSMLVFHIATG